MSCSLDNRPHLVFPRKFNPELHVLRRRGIHNIHWISRPTTRRRRLGQTGVIVPVVLHGTDGVVCMPDARQPSSLHSRTGCSIVRWLVRMTCRTWRRRLEEATRETAVQCGPFGRTGPAVRARLCFTSRWERIRIACYGCDGEELDEERKHHRWIRTGASDCRAGADGSVDIYIYSSFRPNEHGNGRPGHGYSKQSLPLRELTLWRDGQPPVLHQMSRVAFVFPIGRAFIYSAYGSIYQA